MLKQPQHAEEQPKNCRCNLFPLSVPSKSLIFKRKTFETILLDQEQENHSPWSVLQGLQAEKDFYMFRDLLRRKRWRRKRKRKKSDRDQYMAYKL